MRGVDDVATLERFGAEVIPQLRWVSRPPSDDARRL